MKTVKKQKKEIMALAEKTKHYCNLLIAQSENWLPEEGAKRQKVKGYRVKGTR